MCVCVYEEGSQKLSQIDCCHSITLVSYPDFSSTKKKEKRIELNISIDGTKKSVILIHTNSIHSSWHSNLEDHP